MRILLLSTALIISLQACTPITQQQKLEYQAMQDTGLLVEEKNPGTGVGLGFLPGGGSYYGRRPGIGTLDLLLWPLSIIWDPIIGHNESKKINYDVTIAKIERMRNKELGALEDKHDLHQIDDEVYVVTRRRIKRKYTYPYAKVDASDVVDVDVDNI
jgi:hypothetical protein